MSARAPAAGPGSLIGLVTAVVSGAIQNFRGMVKNLVIGMIASFLIVLVLNTLIFSGSSGGQANNGRADTTSTMIFWFLIMAMAGFFFSQVRSRGLGKTAGKLATLPGWVAGSLRKTGKDAVPLALAGLAIALFLRIFFLTTTSTLGVLVFVLGVLFVQQESLSVLALRLGYSDVGRALGRKGPSVPGSAFPVMGFLGAAAGFLLVILLADNVPVYDLVLLLAIAGTGFFWYRSRKSRSLKTIMVCLLGIQVLMLVVLPMVSLADVAGSFNPMGPGTLRIEYSVTGVNAEAPATHSYDIVKTYTGTTTSDTVTVSGTFYGTTEKDVSFTCRVRASQPGVSTIKDFKEDIETGDSLPFDVTINIPRDVETVTIYCTIDENKNGITYPGIDVEFHLNNSRYAPAGSPTGEPTSQQPAEQGTPAPVSPTGEPANPQETEQGGSGPSTVSTSVIPAAIGAIGGLVGIAIGAVSAVSGGVISSVGPGVGPDTAPPETSDPSSGASSDGSKEFVDANGNIMKAKQGPDGKWYTADGTQLETDHHVGDTHSYTDEFGQPQTVTLNPDGTWRKPDGTQVDIDRIDAVNKQHQEDQDWAQHEQQIEISKDKEKAIKDDDALHETLKHDLEDTKEFWKDFYEHENEFNTEMAKHYLEEAEGYEHLREGAEYIKKGCDVIIFVGKYTVPGGKKVAEIYEYTSEFAESAADGHPGKGVAKVLIKAGEKTIEHVGWHKLGHYLGDKSATGAFVHYINTEDPLATNINEVVVSATKDKIKGLAPEGLGTQVKKALEVE